jgi:hypothetical protein
MRVLLDAGAFIHSEFAEPTVKEVSVRWGSGESAFEVHGLKRKQPDKSGRITKNRRRRCSPSGE